MISIRVLIIMTGIEWREGKINNKKLRLVQAWIEIHEEELMANWELASQGETIFKIDPLK